MTRLIDADLLEKEIYKWMPKDQETWMDSDLPPIENLVVSIMMTIQEQPTIDAVPVRHGKWVEKHHAYSDEEAVIEEWQSCRCSECGRYDTRPYMYYFDEPNYCSYCGAKMDEE